MAEDNKGSEDDKNMEIVSKTRLKKFAHSLQDLAKDLAKMPEGKRNKLNLDNSLKAAIEESKRITSHIARKRHFQYMGKLLLKSNYEQIISDIEQLENQHANFAVRDQIINLWIDQLLLNNNDLMNHLYSHYQHDQVTSIRQLLRNLIKKPTHAATRKKLFQALRELDQHQKLVNPITLSS